MSRPRVLFIDAYDSFTNNIISLVETELGVEVTAIHIDSDVADFDRFVGEFDAVIAGPGPGNPLNAKDVGLVSQLWSLDDLHVKPVLGVCLGFQSLVCSFGGGVEKLSGPRHGISTRIETCSNDLFDGMPAFESIQYHSLRGLLGSERTITWEPTEACPELQPLAWDTSSIDDGPILMSVRHKSKPFWAVQFHPESVCSSKEASRVVRNWWTLCTQWNLSHGSASLAQTSAEVMSSLDIQESFTQNSDYSPVSQSPTIRSEDSCSSITSFNIAQESASVGHYFYSTIPIGTLDVKSVINRLRLGEDEMIVLDSEKRLMPSLGRYSIIAVLEPDTTKFLHNAGESTYRVVGDSGTRLENIESTKAMFTHLKSFLNQHKIIDGVSNIPFWGGLIGYVTYEACLETINVPITRRQQSKRDDVCFAFVERSIVIDHLEGKLYIQSIKPQDQKWTQSISEQLQNASLSTKITETRSFDAIKVLKTRLPDQTSYQSKIANCKEEIRAGNSYELCLTNQAIFMTSKGPSNNTSWVRYQALRTLNPAPFASYLRLGSVTILSTSPERFINWTRPVFNHRDSQQTSICQFRPIKGTVQKRIALPDGITKNVTLEQAQAILSTPKETAENLMIVDLIRHDLHGVVGSGNVRTRSLMQIEEYSTVYQLVSVIEGTLLSDLSSSNPYSGIDVLASSLPPGSMTGAPKKRACEILGKLEDEPRSVYSGVIGYMCVGGGGDFSVTIRTVFKWDDEDVVDNAGNVSEKWHIGAGGAITVLSDLEDEWNEMNGKLASTMRLFQV